MKRYVRERGTATVRRLLRTGEAAVSRLSEVEVASALVRRAREGAFTERERDRALDALERDLAVLHVVEITADIGRRSRDLLRRHPLRAADALQLASCLFLQDALSEPVPLVVFDDRLARAASAEGLTVLPRQRSARGDRRD